MLRKAEDTIFPYSEEYAASHTAFAERMWPHKLRRRDPLYNRWKFRGPATGPVNGLLLAVVDGRVVGQAGFIPVTLWADGREYPAQWGCDIMVDPAVRRQGLASLLTVVALARPAVTLGSNPSTPVDAGSNKFGFRSMLGPRTMILPLDPLTEIRKRLPHPLQAVAPFLSTCTRRLIALRAKSLLNAALPKDIRVGSWIDVLDRVQALNVPCPHIVHDVSFFQWRGQGFPHFVPQLRSISTLSGAFAILDASPNLLIVFEWNAPAEEDAVPLFRSILELAFEHQTQTIAVLANSLKERHLLSRLGFLAYHKPYKIVYYPEEPMKDSAYFHYCFYDSDEHL